MAAERADRPAVPRSISNHARRDSTVHRRVPNEGSHALRTRNGKRPVRSQSIPLAHRSLWQRPSLVVDVQRPLAGLDAQVGPRLCQQ